MKWRSLRDGQTSCFRLRIGPDESRGGGGGGRGGGGGNWSAGMAAGLLVFERLIAAAYAGPHVANICALALLIFGGVLLFGGLAHVLGAARWSDLRALRRHRIEELGDA